MTSDPPDEGFDPDRLFDFSVEAEIEAEVEVEEPKPAAAVVEPALQELIARVEEPVTLGYLGEVAALLKDCERIREHAMRKNKITGEMQIFNPFLFEKAVGRRQSILSAAVKLHQELWSQHAQHEFFRLVIQTVAQESPPTAHRLIAALRKINSPVLEVVERVAI